MLELPGDARILVLRRDNIGDLVCTTPLFDALRAQLPRAWIGALVTTYNAEVLARNPALDEVFAYEKLKHRSSGIVAFVRDRLRQMSQIRRRQLDCVLVPAPSPHTLGIARSLKPRRVIAPPRSVPAGMHEVERSFGVGRPLGLAGAPGPLRLIYDRISVRGLQDRVGAGPFVAVHISARRAAQRWPLTRYAALVHELGRESRVMLLWAPGSSDDPRHPGDDAAAAQVAAGANSPNLVTVPTPDLATLIAALALARIVICPDGGAMHLAAGLGKPVVALFGDSPVERWRPWGVRHRVLQPESRNLADLALEPVLEACRELG